MQRAFRMQAVGARALRAAQTAPLPYRWFPGSLGSLGSLSRRGRLGYVSGSPARLFGSSATRRARSGGSGGADEPDKSDQPKNAPDDNTAEKSPSASASPPSTSPTASPSSEDTLREAFSGLVGRGRSSRHRSHDGLPPVLLPEWFLHDHVRLHADTPPPLASTINPLSPDLAATRRLLFPGLPETVPPPKTPPPPVTSEERERMQLFFEALFNGAAWDAKKVAEALADLDRHGDDTAIRHRSAAVAASAAYLAAALGGGGRPDDPATGPTVLDPDDALHIPAVLTQRPYRDHIRSLAATDDMLEYAVTPGADQDVAHGLPFQLDYGERIGFTELRATVAAELQAVSPRRATATGHTTAGAGAAAASKKMADLHRPVSVLTLMNYSGSGKATAVVDSVAQSLGTDVVHLDAAVLADVVGGYLGQTAYWARGGISMLGYTVADRNGRLARRLSGRDERDLEDEDAEEHDEDADNDDEGNNGRSTTSSLVLTSRLPFSLMRQAGLAAAGLAAASRLSGSGRSPFSVDADDKWDDLKTNHVLEAMVRAGDVLPMPSSSATTETKRPLLLHVHNYLELSAVPEGAELLAKLRGIVDRLWQRGRKVVLVGSAAAHATGKTSLVARADDLRQEGCHVIPFRVRRVATSVPAPLRHCLAEALERQDYFCENMANVRSLVAALTAEPPRLADWAWMARGRWDDVDETLQTSLSHVVYDIHWVYRLVALVLGQHGSERLSDEQSLVAALRTLSGEELWWEKRTGAKAPYYDPLTLSRSGREPAEADHTENHEPDASSSTPAAPLDLNEYEKKLQSNVIDRSAVHTTFADVVCATETIESLKALTTLSLIRPEAFRYGVLATERIPGCLLYGPPGTGKTLLAKAVAQQGGASMLEISAASINDMWLGNSEKNVQALFSLARKMAPVVIFLDEADALLGARQTGPGSRAAHRETITQFLREWDGLRTAHGHSDGQDGHPHGHNAAFIMVATNRPFDLDEAVLRRLPRRILVDLPLREGRKRILEVMLREEQLDTAVDPVDLDRLAAETELYSGSDLKNLCVAAAMAAVREEVHAQETHPGPEPFVFADRRILGRRHFDTALHEIGASISEDMASLQAIRRFDERYGDHRRKKRKHIGFEVVPKQASSEEAMVRQPM